jgi:hypothetical protein
VIEIPWEQPGREQAVRQADKRDLMLSQVRRLYRQRMSRGRKEWAVVAGTFTALGIKYHRLRNPRGERASVRARALWHSIAIGRG